MYYPSYQNYAYGRYCPQQKRISFGQLVNGAEKAVDSVVDAGIKTLYAGAAGGVIGGCAAAVKTAKNISKGCWLKVPFSILGGVFRCPSWIIKGAGVGLFLGLGYNMYKHFYPDSMKYQSQYKNYYC